MEMKTEIPTVEELQNEISELKKQIQTGSKWWRGGTLHDADLATWHSSTFGNALATSSDWISAMCKMTAPARPLISIKSGDGDQLLEYSIMLAVAITKGSQNAISKPGGGALKACEMAMLAAAMLGFITTEPEALYAGRK